MSVLRLLKIPALIQGAFCQLQEIKVELNTFICEAMEIM